MQAAILCSVCINLEFRVMPCTPQHHLCTCCSGLASCAPDLQPAVAQLDLQGINVDALSDAAKTTPMTATETGIGRCAQRSLHTAILLCRTPQQHVVQNPLKCAWLAGQ